MTELEPETVRWGYRFILGREPESVDVVRSFQELGTIERFRRALINSDEFSQIYDQLRGAVGPAKHYHFSEQDRIVFLHIPKTGGTTLHHILASRFPSNEICPVRFNTLPDWKVGDLAQYKLFSGHFDFLTCHLIPGNKTIITLLREPKARILSIYYFLRAHRTDVIAAENMKAGRLAKELSLLEFLRCSEIRHDAGVNNGMVQALLGGTGRARWEVGNDRITSSQQEILEDPQRALEKSKRNLASLSAFGIMEDFDVSLSVIASVLSLPKPKEVRSYQVLEEIVHSEPRLEPVKKEPMTPEISAELDRVTSLDQELYRYAKRLLRQRWLLLQPQSLWTKLMGWQRSPS